MVYSSWRGIPYTRKYVIPANPKSSGQQETRGVFSWGSATWKNAPTLLKAPWTAFAKGKAFTDRNAFLGQNTKALRTATTMANIVFSPGAGGGLPPASITATGSAGHIAIGTTNPSAPTGWTITSMVGLAVKSVDPHTASNSPVYAGSDNVTFDSVNLAGLTAGTYEVGAYLVWTKPGSVLAYSTAVMATATVT